MIKVELLVDGDIICRVHENYQKYDVEGNELILTNYETQHKTNQISYNYDRVIGVGEEDY